MKGSVLWPMQLLTYLIYVNTLSISNQFKWSWTPAADELAPDIINVRGFVKQK